MFAGGTPFGFYNAPVSKALLVITGAASALNVLFPFLKIHTLIGSVDTLNYIQDSKILNGLLRCLCYSNGKNLIFGSLLLYNFRIFEHRYGSQKFADYVLASTIIGAGLQYVIMLTHDMKIESFPTGPFWMIFSLYIPFYLSIPSVNSSSFFGLLPSTGKLFTYVLGLQMMFSSKGAVLSGLSGIIAGLVCHFNIFHVQRWLTIPHSVSNLFSRTFGTLFRSAAPENSERHQGATLEIQRQIRMDELDQQMWRLQDMNLARRRPIFANLVRGTAAAAPVDPTNTNRSTEPIQQPTTEVSEEQIQRLVEMGFTRYAVLQALTASNNNMTTAMNILLSE